MNQIVSSIRNGKFEFLKQVFEITDTTAKNNHVLMSSHSAVTLIAHDNKKIKFFDIKNNSANCYDLPKQIAINKLSHDLIRYSEDEQLLSIINTIRIEKKPVISQKEVRTQFFRSWCINFTKTRCLLYHFMPLAVTI